MPPGPMPGLGVGNLPLTMGLQQFERRLERLVEGVFAKAFRSGLQPVEVGRRLAREMDLHRTVGVRGTIAPNHFEISLSKSDAEHFAPMAETFARDLGDAAREHARDEGYVFVGPVQIELKTDPSLTTGMFLLVGEMHEADGGVGVGSLVLSDGSRVPIDQGPVTIGRNPDCEVVLADPNVSRRHAEVRRDSGGFLVNDLGSLNGMRVNGARVKEQRLVDGDEIVIGTTTLRFEAS